MWTKFCFFLTVLLVIQFGHAQSDSNYVKRISTVQCDVEGGPNRSVNDLVIYFLGVEFADSIKAQLAGSELELIFLIDTLGNARLREINGTELPVVFEKFEKRTLGLAPFKVMMKDCQEIEYIYFITFRYPNYQTGSLANTMYFANPIARKTWNDFDSIFPTENNLTLTFGGHYTNYFGPISSNLTNGGGMLLDYLGNINDFQFGLTMQINFQTLDKPIQLGGNDPYSTRPTLFNFGFLIGKEILPNTYIQFKPSYTQLDLTKQSSNDAVEIFKHGFSAGVGIQRDFPIGRMVLSGPNLVQNCLSVYAVLNNTFIQQPISNGASLNLGLAYSMQLFGIDRYYLKQ